jgi:hypothetical protein
MAIIWSGFESVKELLYSRAEFGRRTNRRQLLEDRDFITCLVSDIKAEHSLDRIS